MNWIQDSSGYGVHNNIIYYTVCKNFLKFPKYHFCSLKFILTVHQSVYMNFKSIFLTNSFFFSVKMNQKHFLKAVTTASFSIIRLENNC